MAVPTDIDNRKYLIQVVAELPPHLLISATNTIKLLQANPEYFNDVNTKYFQKYRKNLNDK